jgi:hypothetical protein
MLAMTTSLRSLNVAADKVIGVAEATIVLVMAHALKADSRFCSVATNCLEAFGARVENRSSRFHLDPRALKLQT